MESLITELLQAVITVATPIVAAYAVRLLHAKSEQAKEALQSEIAGKYIGMTDDIVENVVMYVSQTFADDMKQKDQWTKENQTEAFKRAADMAKSLLTAEAAKFLTEAYGDLNKYLAAKIEAEVRLQKG